MLRKDTTEKIKNLENIIKYHSDGTYKLNNTEGRMLFNPLTLKDCQVFELFAEKEGDAGLGIHAHPESDELFYVVNGSVRFHDGVILTTGQHRLIKESTDHSVYLSKGTACIVIVRPPDKSLSGGDTIKWRVRKNDLED